MREVVILPFMTTAVKGIANLMTHSECMNVLAQPVIGYSYYIAMARSYGVLKPGSGKIDVCLKNHSAKQVTLPKCTAMGEITAAIVILALFAPNPTRDKSGRGEATTQERKYESQKVYWTKIVLTRLRDWSQDEQKKA